MKIYSNFDLTSYNSYRVKAICKRAFLPDNEDDIRELYNKNAGNSLITIGSGNNVILKQEFYDGDFVIFSGNYGKSAIVDDNCIVAEAGISMRDLSIMALENKLSGLEIFYDIPSSLGGAVVMNAGASGEEIKDLLLKVRYYDPYEDCFKSITKEEINFEYRNSFFQKNPDMIVCEAFMQLERKDDNTIKSKMEAIKDARWKKQPRDYPNGGSVFKRPPGRFVGPMIDELGLKGYKIGDAQISEKHSGFIINCSNATGSQIIELIHFVKEKVLLHFGVELEIEQRII